MKSTLHDYQTELSNASFNVENMNAFLLGGKSFADKMKLAYQMVERDPYMIKKNEFDLNTQENLELTMKQIKRAVDVRDSLRKRDPELLRAYDIACHFMDKSFSLRYGVHDFIFKNAIFAQGTKEQYEKYDRAVSMCKVIGCYAMTELDHSSALRDLETSATFDKATQEFIIHTPNLRATKFWVGMAGHTATHAVVLAKLTIDTKDCGLNWFIVQLRQEDGTLMPGVSAGYIGEKVGRTGTDNGYIRFTHVRIPRENMLSRWSRVDADGTYYPPKDPAAPYISLISERLSVASGSALELAQSLTVAIRFAILRKQGENGFKVLDYQTHQSFLIPSIAFSYVCNIAGNAISNVWSDVEKQSSDVLLQRAKEFHCLSSGLKTFIGWYCMGAFEQIRLSMGGHAYSAYNAVGKAMLDFAPLTTAGGDNVVLAQQNARYLVSLLKDALSDKTKYISGTLSSYFASSKQFLAEKKWNVKNETELQDHTKLHFLHALKWISVHHLYNISMLMLKDVKTLGQLGAWNNQLVELIECSHLNVIVILLEQYYKAISTVTDASMQKILYKLGNVFAVQQMKKYLPLFLQYDYFGKTEAVWIQQLYHSLNKEIRIEAVPLTTAFGFPDFILKSPFATTKGDAYEKYFEIISNSKGSDPVASYWPTLIAPLVSAKL